MNTNPTALIIDDEPDIRALVALSLDRIGLDTHTAANLAEARNLLATYEFDVCLTDMKLPDGDGVEFVKHLQQVQPNLPVAVVTAHGNMSAAVEAMKNGAFDFVSKPVDLKLLRKLVNQAIRVRTEYRTGESLDTTTTKDKDNNQTTTHADDSLLSRQPSPLNQEHVDKQGLLLKKTQTPPPEPSDQTTLSTLYEQAVPDSNNAELIGKGRLIGRSEPMQTLRKLIYKVARTNAPVWITGESGTGKELIARLIHENGPRSDSPFVAINCGAIPSELMESEMFGHRKGSFTGAHSNHDGLFKRADGGTLFLDEVAELPLHMQVKLLRAIQERTIRPVGSSEEISIDVRLLSASHKDLGAEVDLGRFRHDLYYRLNVICIKAPSLRHRSEDVVDIARHILRSIAGLEGLNITATLAPDAECILGTYSFPGNVRELENILERAVALSDDARITAADLDISDTGTLPSHQWPQHNDIQNMATTDERKAILTMLTQTRWNRKEAAKQLGMTYRQLRYRIQQYGIDNDISGDSQDFRNVS